MSDMHRMSKIRPRLSFLVAAWNEEKRLPLFVQSFLNLSYPERELILCAGGSDGTTAYVLALSDPMIKVLPQVPGEGKQAALRKAFHEASGEIVVLTDADVVLSDTALERIIAPILLGDEYVTSGISQPMKDLLENTFVQYQYALEHAGYQALVRKRYLASTFGRNSAMRRDVLDEVGAFDEDVAIGTDSFLAKKLVQHGYKIRFVADSVVETDYPTTFHQYCRQRSRWLRGAILNNARFGRYQRVLRATVPPTIGLTMFVLPLLTFWHARLTIRTWSVLAGYAYLRRIEYMQALYKTQDRPPPFSIYYKIGLYMWVEWAAQALAAGQLLSTRLRRGW